MKNIVITFGIFFDGTGNNAQNVDKIIKLCEERNYSLKDARARSLMESFARKILGFSGFNATSYTNYYTNIYSLYRLYDTSFCSQVGLIQHAIYIEGTGTKTAQPDSLIGQSLGVSDTGVIAKTDVAIERIAKSVADIKSNLPSDVHISEIQFDLFGFSRGAAACRHFANRIASEDPRITAALCPLTTRPYYTGALTGKTRFIGLFDTVAAVNDLARMLLPATGGDEALNLCLASGVAEHVFQIAARNECRLNFPLSSVRPLWPELYLPGAHSDVGGGYLPLEEENLFLSRPQAQSVMLDQPDVQTRVYQQACEELRKLQVAPCMAPLARTHKLNIETWSDDRMPQDRYGNFLKRSYAAVSVRKRIVSNAWSKVALQVMLQAAKDAGVIFYPTDNRDVNFILPDELVPLSKIALQQSASVRVGKSAVEFSDKEMECISKKYIHYSANWNLIESGYEEPPSGGASPLAPVSFINRPNKGWERSIYNVFGELVRMPETCAPSLEKSS